MSNFLSIRNVINKLKHCYLVFVWMLKVSARTIYPKNYIMQQPGPLKERNFYPKIIFPLLSKTISHTYSKIINFSNNKSSYTFLKKRFSTRKKVLYLPKTFLTPTWKNQFFIGKKHFLYLPNKNVSNQKIFQTHLKESILRIKNFL